MGRASGQKKRRRAAREMVGLRRKLGRHVTIRDGNMRPDKLSAAISKLLELEREPIEDLSQFRSLVGIGVLAWNLATLNSKDRERIFQASLLESSGSAEPLALKTIVRPLIARKQLLFPHDHRFIVEWDAQEADGDFYLNVASADLRSLRRAGSCEGPVGPLR